MRRLLKLSALGVLIVAALSGCSKLNSTETGTMSVRMTDAPGNFQSVNVSLIQVAAKYEPPVASSKGNSSNGGPKGDDGWTVLWQGSRMCDLLQLRNGVFTSLGEGRLPAGQYNRLRMLFGNGSNVVVDNEQSPLAVPADGLKLNGQFNVPSGGNVDVALDFDVQQSIVFENGYKLKPVVRVFSTQPGTPQPGAIAGIVVAPGVTTWISAVQDTGTVTSTTASPDGHFQLSLLPAGTYSVKFEPVSGYESKTVNGVVVTAGQTTDIGTVELTAIEPPPPAPGAINGQILSIGVPSTATILQNGVVVREVQVPDEYFTVENLAAGTYSVRASAEGYVEQTVENVVVQSGQTTYLGTIELVPVPPPPPGSVSGRVVPPGVPTTVTLLQNGAQVATMAVDGEGNFQFFDVPIGHYSVLFHPDFDYQDVTIEIDVESGQNTNMGDIPLSF